MTENDTTMDETDRFDTPPEEWSQHEKDQFIRGVMIAQAWGMTLDIEAEEVVQKTREHDELSEEWDKLIDGDEHEFNRVMCDIYDVPYSIVDGTLKMRRPYGPRFRDAWKDLMQPAPEEKAAGATVMSFISQAQQRDDRTQDTDT